MINKITIKIFVVAILLLLVGMTASPQINALSVDENCYYDISIDFIGSKEKEIQLSLSSNDYRAVKSILKNLEEDLKESISDKEAVICVENALDDLQLYGIFGNKDIKSLKQLCTRWYQIFALFEKPVQYDNRAELVGGDNAFCLLLSHIKGYVYDHGLIFFLAVLVALASLPFIIMFYPLGVVINFISEMIFSFQHKKPIIPPFPHRVETRYNESYANLISRGLYGRIHNDYTNWGFRFDAFTGIRINLGRDETFRINESYYLGSALFVSWNYDGPH